MPLKIKKQLSYRCSLCDKGFANKFTIKRHLHLIHGQMPEKRLACMLCGFETTTKKGWLYHLQSTHEIQVKSEELKFSSEVEFLKWKEDVERRTHSKFITATGCRVVGDYSRRYYVCHRSGRFISESKGIRRPRLAGSCKMNGKCPAAIKVLCKGGAYSVHFVSTHVGHNLLDQAIVNTNSNPPESLPDVDARSKGSESLSGARAASKTPKSLSAWKQMIISRFSEIVNELTESEIQIVERMVMSLKEKICAIREQNSRANLIKSPGRSRKRRLAPKRGSFSKRETSCQIPSVVTDTEETGDILRIFMDEGPDSIDTVTVEGDCATASQQELQSSATGPFIVNAYHDDIPWEQELEHYEPGHFSITMNQDDDTPWQQELQNCTSGPISVVMEEDDDTLWHKELLQHCTPGLSTNHYIDVEHSYAAPCHLVKQRRTPRLDTNL